MNEKFLLPSSQPSKVVVTVAGTMTGAPNDGVTLTHDKKLKGFIIAVATDGLRLQFGKSWEILSLIPNAGVTVNIKRVQDVVDPDNETDDVLVPIRTAITQAAPVKQLDRVIFHTREDARFDSSGGNKGFVFL